MLAEKRRKIVGGKSVWRPRYTKLEVAEALTRSATGQSIISCGSCKRECNISDIPRAAIFLKIGSSLRPTVRVKMVSYHVGVPFMYIVACAAGWSAGRTGIPVTLSRGVATRRALQRFRAARIMEYLISYKAVATTLRAMKATAKCSAFHDDDVVRARLTGKMRKRIKAPVARSKGPVPGHHLRGSFSIRIPATGHRK